MIANQIIKLLIDWAPQGAAWEKDNIGLQVGSKNRKLKGIFLTLELTEKSFDEAIKNDCNFIFTHHPLIFNPLKNLDFDTDSRNNLIRKLIQNDITLFSAHTNLDFTKDGVSFQLAKTLGLKNIRFLKNEEGNQVKVVVFVPVEFTKKVANAIFEVGGGVIGEYEKCSFTSSGKGTFQGSKFSNPAIGKRNVFETVNEEKLEALVNRWEIGSVLNAIKKVHPYEEPAIDVYPVKNKNVNFGFGAIGELSDKLSEKQFLSLVSQKLKTKALKYCVGKTQAIKTVAVCGGSCAEMWTDAVHENADAFVTADIKYHSFQDAEGKILFVDAGHFETEVVVLNKVKQKLEKFIKQSNENIKVIKYKGSTNPIKFYIK